MYREAYIERDHAVIARQAVSPSAAQQIKRAPPPPPSNATVIGADTGAMAQMYITNRSPMRHRGCPLPRNFYTCRPPY